MNQFGQPPTGGHRQNPTGGQRPQHPHGRPQQFPSQGPRPVVSTRDRRKEEEFAKNSFSFLRLLVMVVLGFNLVFTIVFTMILGWNAFPQLAQMNKIWVGIGFTLLTLPVTDVGFFMTYRAMLAPNNSETQQKIWMGAAVMCFSATFGSTFLSLLYIGQFFWGLPFPEVAFVVAGFVYIAEWLILLVLTVWAEFVSPENLQRMRQSQAQARGVQAMVGVMDDAFIDAAQTVRHALEEQQREWAAQIASQETEKLSRLVQETYIQKGVVGGPQMRQPQLVGASERQDGGQSSRPQGPAPKQVDLGGGGSQQTTRGKSTKANPKN